MKKYAKSIVTSLLMAVAFGAMTVGTTFALFTSQAKTSIEVEAGKVEVLQTAQIMSVKELGSVDVIPVNGVYTNSIGGKTYIDSQNNGIIRLENWAPGDKAVIKITNTNNSNVTIKTRFAVAHTTTSNPDLFGALRLNYDVKDANSQDIGYKFMDWTAVEPTVTKISDVTVTIEFPDGDNGEILFGDANHDNQYQNCNCAIAFSQQAVQGNATTGSILEQLNAALDSAAATDGRNKTMHDALADVAGVMSESLLKTAGYVWGVNDDYFHYPEEGTTNAYFQIYDEMPLTQTNSIYASSDWETATVNLTGVGFDAGNASGITAISYSGASEGRTNTIRTNGGTLTINAPLDEVTHYGLVDYVDIIAIKSSSYEEKGRTSLIKIANGNVAIDGDSKVGEIHFAKTGETFNNIKITLEEGAQLPELISRDPVGTNLENAILVCEVVESNASEFYWLSGNATIEDQQVLVSTDSEGTDKVAATTENSTAVSIANAKVGDEVSETGENVKAAAEMTPEEVAEATAPGKTKTFAEIENKEDLIAFRDAWNEGKLVGGQTFKLMANVDISGENWYPIGTWKYPFNGTFNGNGKTINGLYANSTDAEHVGIYSNGDTVGFGETFGFFGIVGDGETTVSNVTFTAVNINIYNGKDVGAVIGYAPSLGKFKNANASGEDHFIDIDKWTNESGVGSHAVTLSGITVNGSITGKSAVAGIAGKIYTSGRVQVLNCTNNAVINGGSNTSGIAGYIHYSSDITIDGNTNNGNVRLTGGAGIVNLNDLGNKVIINNTNTGNIIYDASYNKSSANSYSWDFIAGGIHNNQLYSQYHGNTNTGKFYIQENVEAEATKGVLVVDTNEVVTINSVSEYTDVLVNGTLNINADTSVYGCMWVSASGEINVNAALEIRGTQGTLSLKNNSLVVGENGSITAYYIALKDNYTLINNGTIRITASANDPNAASNGLKKNNLTFVNNGTFIGESNVFYGDNLQFTNNGTYYGNLRLTGNATIINNENGTFQTHNGNGIDFEGGSGSFTNYAEHPFGQSFDGINLKAVGTYTIIGATPHLGYGLTNLELTQDGNNWIVTSK